ncbi:hypothetical protein [Candidatus Steffania adelgidicola]|nr:hypothetical protein [Candidatus Steffania adelgidicola]
MISRSADSVSVDFNGFTSKGITGVPGVSFVAMLARLDSVASY